jgi:hypothetical protein
MKSKHIAAIILAAAFACAGFLLAGCATNPNGSQTIKLGTTFLTIPTSDVQAANAIVANDLGALVNGTATAALTGQSVNARTIASAEEYSAAATLQANIGNIVPAQVLSSSSSVQSIGQTFANDLNNVVASQALVNALQSKAASTAPPAAP